VQRKEGDRGWQEKGRGRIEKWEGKTLEGGRGGRRRESQTVFIEKNCKAERQT